MLIYVAVWEVLTGGEAPYANMDNLSTIFAVLNGKRLEIPSTCHPRLSKLIQSTWTKEPEQRPAFSEIHEELENIEQELGLKKDVTQKRDPRILSEAVELP